MVREIIVGTVGAREFRGLLDAAGLTQRELGLMTGSSVTAVNRWCSLTAADRVSPPWTIILLVRAFAALRPVAREALLDEEPKRYRGAPGDVVLLLRIIDRLPAAVRGALLEEALR